MLDIGWGEMLVIAVIMIVVVGPKELPGMLRTFGRTTSKLRVMAGDFRKQFDEALKEAELDDLKKVADDVRALNPKNEIRKALSPMEKAAEDVRAGLDAAFTPAPKPQEEPTVPSSDAGLVPAEPLKGAGAATPAAAAPVAPVATPATGASVSVAAKTAAKKPVAAKKPATAKKTDTGKVAASPELVSAAPAKTSAKPRTAKAKARGDAS
jgi:sec-independent protein translocase protein TatB